MRRLFLIATTLAIAACARAPQPVATAPVPQIPVHRGSGDLIGLTTSEVGALFGQPSFQVREGAGHKQQWANATCVLDAYFYPPASGRGVERVAHVDARRPSGDDIDIPTCTQALTR